MKQSVSTEPIEKLGDDFSVIYSPFHGTGNKPVRRILDMIGIKNLRVVKEQELPDPDFSTVKSPNPEEKAGFSYAIEMAKKEMVFEAAIERLEEIVSMLESGDFPLDKSLELFEEGTTLVKECNKKLNSVEKSVKILTQGDTELIEKDFITNEE